MSGNRKIKSQGKISKPCTNCFAPVYLKFNLTYFRCGRDFTDAYKAQLFNRMCELSSEPYLTICGHDKKIGFEFEALDVGREIPEEFKQRFDRKYYSKFTVMRLYPNNNPVMARVVGVTVNMIFYIFYIFIGERGYKR